MPVSYPQTVIDQRKLLSAVAEALHRDWKQKQHRIRGFSQLSKKQ
jgi:hypothetical protein